MSDFKISFKVNFSVPAVDFLRKSMTTGNIIDEVYENLNATDYYVDQIKEDARYIWDKRVSEDVLQKLNNTSTADLEQFIKIHADKLFCDVDARENYPNDEVVFAVPCEFDLGDFIDCLKGKTEERKTEASQKKEMSLDRAKELLTFFVNHECVGENSNTAIQKLFSIGMTEKEIQYFGFSAKDIENAKESEDEFEI